MRKLLFKYALTRPRRFALIHLKMEEGRECKSSRRSSMHAIASLQIAGSFENDVRAVTLD